MNIVKSHNEKNAVKVIALALNFSKSFSTEAIENLIEKFSKMNYFVEEFNNIDKQQEISMTINPDGTQTHSQSLGGIVCSKSDVNKNIIWTLELNKNFLVITCRAYSRWVKISEKVHMHIDEVFKLLNETKITQLTLEYLDEFAIIETNEDWKNYLFKKDCKYILDNIHDLNEYWHVNHGYFKKLENLHADSKLLDTLNINFFADKTDNLKEKINIKMQHKVLYTNEIEYTKEGIEQDFNEVHIHSKKIFEEIINDQILDKFDRGE